MSYVYIRSAPGLWTVGFYHPEGAWLPESDHDNTGAAAERVAYLNGGGIPPSMLDAARRVLAVVRGGAPDYPAIVELETAVGKAEGRS